jgi:hypothetical protein
MKYKLKTILEIRKSEMQHMYKANGKHFKLFEIKMTWWLTPPPSPKEMKVLNFIGPLCKLTFSLVCDYCCALAISTHVC